MDSRKTALVVEDDPMIRVLVRTLLEEHFHVVEAENGLRALIQAWDAQPDLIVLDRDMPVMRGDEAAPYLRVLAPAVFIVAFSASVVQRPLWADASVDKGDFGRLSEVAHSLLPRLAAAS